MVSLMKNIILASSSSVHGSEYLEYLDKDLKMLFNGVSKLLFIPYASPSGVSHESYTNSVKNRFGLIDIEVKGIHNFTDPKKAIANSEAIFVGGGNTFLLLSILQKLELLDILRKKILDGTPYLGTSAGSNICGVGIHTTNDMPIVLPSSLAALGIIPFNINPHFIPRNNESTHMGETRETRIKEYHTVSTIPVIGLQEGSWLYVSGNQILLKGNLDAYLFKKNKQVVLCSPKTIF